MAIILRSQDRDFQEDPNTDNAGRDCPARRQVARPHGRLDPH
jgi:hypothetical protein